jgi:NAD(P)-dependent dehydrogenase (short-subunit alcohol dehydrogenase family)
MASTLKDKTVLVVGRGRGLARAITEAARAAGATVIAAGRDPAGLALTRSLAVELAPIRVHAISPGVVDAGAWDAHGEDGKARLFAERSERNPAWQSGAPEDLTLHVDGGERLT